MQCWWFSTTEEAAAFQTGKPTATTHSSPGILVNCIAMSLKGFLFKLDNFLILLCYQHQARLHHLFVHTRVSSVCFFCPCVYLAQTLFLLPCLAQTWDIGVSSAFALPSAHTQGASVNCVFFNVLASVNKTNLIITTQLMIVIVVGIVSTFSVYPDRAGFEKLHLCSRSSGRQLHAC